MGILDEMTAKDMGKMHLNLAFRARERGQDDAAISAAALASAAFALANLELGERAESASERLNAWLNSHDDEEEEAGE